MSAPGPNPPEKVIGQSAAALPGTSDVDFLGDLKRAVDLNAEVAHCAFQPSDRLDYVPHRTMSRPGVAPLAKGENGMRSGT
jgi:hypothetical protein